MEEIKTNVVIASAIKEINKKEISLDELFEYFKEVNFNLKGTNYHIKDINIYDIIKFFELYSYFGHISNNFIIIKENIDSRLDKFLKMNSNNDFNQVLKKGNKYIFPIIVNNELYRFYFTSRNELLNSIKKDFYYDLDNADSYILDLDVVKNIIGEENISLFLQDFITNSKIIKKEIFDYNNLLEFHSNLEQFKDIKYKNIENCFKLNDDISKILEISNLLSIYLNISNKNKIKIEENSEILNKLTK